MTIAPWPSRSRLPSDIYSPVSGKIIAVNRAGREPRAGQLRSLCAGWLFRIKLDDESELANLLDAEGYQNVVNEE